MYCLISWAKSIPAPKFSSTAGGYVESICCDLKPAFYPLRQIRHENPGMAASPLPYGGQRAAK
jgi:hypothetical protein